MTGTPSAPPAAPPPGAPGAPEPFRRRFAPPDPLPPLTFREKLRAVWRGGVILIVTALLIPVYLLARLLPGRQPDRWVAGLWGRILVRLVGVRLEIVGAPMKEPGALVANHVSWIDILALAAAAPAHFVSKSEVAHWPVVGFIARIADAEFIERRPAQAREHEARLARRIREGDLLCFFPEGTSSDGLVVLPFKTTLFAIFQATKAKAQPVSLKYTPPEHLPRRFYGYYDDLSFGDSAGAVLARSRGGRLTVTFHPPVDPAEIPDRKRMAAFCEAQVRSAAL
ncbi:1-acyl-sn-glycerol-3-phosphate acyltransferase [Neomegalonema sp.]|uniref:lysophospholipid acyltransferase family protein n=1 Tax=Neomegalonema sp. TaxID=2039713 RepID=UPI002614F2EF|nr:lysophospholipid acyltransferase family protein [Neomegalonema sp.]MDD2867208.1 lysophospholipid acyltransferase family protein [Neomegalonema sp.]